jgi:flagella basal body P-ring formation protein FlgA
MIKLQRKTVIARKSSLGTVTVAAAAALFFGGASLASAEEIQDAAAIRTAVEAAVTSGFAANRDAEGAVDVAPIDARLRLPRCDNIKVDISSPNAAMLTAKVSCDTPSWTIYVPVRLHLWVHAVVAATNLPPNTALTMAQLTRGRVDVFATTGVISDMREAAGKVLRVGLVAGAPILPSQLDLPIAVHRGQKVVLTLTAPQMTIRATALALEDGRVGDSISVENADSQKTLRATVARDGGVEINF